MAKPSRTREENRLYTAARRAADPERARVEARLWAKRNPVRWWFHKLRAGARRRGFKFTLTLKQLQILILNAGDNCPCCGVDFVPMGHATRANMDQARSADRVFSRPEYSFREIRIICRRCNTVKGDGDAVLHTAIASYIRKWMP